MTSWPAFETRAPGKWVLAGEHAVLKGATAVALPYPEFGLELSFVPSTGGGLVVEGDESLGGPPARELIEGLLMATGISQPPAGRLRIRSSIPIGAGLGSSGALCVAFTRWVAPALELKSEDWTAFATRLEDRFHGRSSGMDVAVISAGAPVSFVRGQGAQPLGLARVPRFTLHDTGLRARTSECVAQVEAYRGRRPADGTRWDAQMDLASLEATDGLCDYSAGGVEAGLAKIAQAMSRAQECFEAWDLVPAEAVELMRRVRAEGALAAKLTGAGGGGMVVALWG